MTKRRRKRNRYFTPPEYDLVTAFTIEPGPELGTFDYVTSTYELVFTGIYTESNKVGERRTPVPDIGYSIAESTDEDDLDLMMFSSRLDAANVVGPRLALLSDDDGPGIQVDLGGGVKHYRVPEDLSVEEHDALRVLISIQRTEQFLMEGGSVSGVMHGMSLAFAMEQLRIRRFEAAVRHAGKTTGALPAARNARSAKSAAHKEWANEVFPDCLASANGNRKAALRTMVADFKSHFPECKPVTARTIGNWVAAEQRTRAN